MDEVMNGVGLEMAWSLDTIGQMLYIQAVVMPEIVEVISRHKRNIVELGKTESEENK